MAVQSTTPTLTLSVPTSVAAGGSVNVVATVTSAISWTGRWRASDGSFNAAANTTTFWNAPDRAGVHSLTFIVTDILNREVKATAYITVGDLRSNIHNPVERIEIAGVDVTARRVPQAGLTVTRRLDSINFGVFKNDTVRLVLDNSDGELEIGATENLFTRAGYAVHGRGAPVVISLSRDGEAGLQVVFTGIVNTATSTLNGTQVQVNCVNMGLFMANLSVDGFGAEITRVITDYENAAADYDKFDPVFYFPPALAPIVRGSVRDVAVLGSGGTRTAIEIVEAISAVGQLSNTKAEIDYTRGLIRFESPPDAGAGTRIEATWKVPHQYKRPDKLVDLLIREGEIPAKLGITDSSVLRHFIEKSEVTNAAARVFSSHGRPNFREAGIVRWLKRQDGANPAIWMAHDNRLVKYDEALDTYEKVTTTPDDDTIDILPPGEYGEEITDLAVNIQLVSGRGINAFGASATRFYGVDFPNSSPQNQVLRAWNLDGTLDTSFTAIGGLGVPASNTSSGVRDMAVHGNLAFLLRHPTQNSLGRSCWIYNLTTRQRIATINLTNFIQSVTATDQHVIFGRPSFVGNPGSLSFFNHDGTFSHTVTFSGGFSPDSLAVDSSYIYVRSVRNIRVFTHAGVEVPGLNFTLPDGVPTADMFVHNGSLAVFSGSTFLNQNSGTTKTVHFLRLVSSLTYQAFIINQFDTVDYDTFYIQSGNTLRGDISQDLTFNKNSIQKYVKSTDAFETVLDNTDGVQLAHPNDDVSHIRLLSDSRKKFKNIRRNNKMLIFFRKVLGGNAGVAYHNDTDDITTDIYSESFGTNDGLRYSMDFETDERSDGIYVYTFVVKYNLSGTSFTSATLKVYRRRVEPTAAQTEIFSETFTGTSDTDDDYPISVSSTILANDRSKFYFVLDYFNEDDETVSKSELCEVAKDGSGSRTVLKTYDNPLVGPRSPAKRGSDYFYLEGGWVRRSKTSTDDDVPDEEHYYPNEGGHLIEIESDGSITDHGEVWRSATQLDSPDPTSEVYAGWGLHNAVVSNMIADDRGNLHFVAGYGLSSRLVNNLPSVSPTFAISPISNFVWLQWGHDLAGKIVSYPSEITDAWQAIQALAVLSNSEVGWGAAMADVEALLAVQSGLLKWQGYSLPFFRVRAQREGTLRSALGSGGTVSSIAVDGVVMFPSSGLVIIDKELFSYTGLTSDTTGFTLTGVVRGQHESAIVVHEDGAAVHFVDYFLSGESGGHVVSVPSRSVDFVNLKNTVKVPYGDDFYETEDTDSIALNGRKPYAVSSTLLSRHDRVWAERIGNILLSELGTLKPTAQLTLTYSPEMQLGAVIVFYQSARLRMDYEKFLVLEVSHNTQSYRTTVQVRRID